MFGRKERKMKGKKIGVIEIKMPFFYVVWKNEGKCRISEITI